MHKRNNAPVIPLTLASMALERGMNRLKMPIVPKISIAPAIRMTEPILFSFCVSFILIPFYQPHERMTVLFYVFFERFVFNVIRYSVGLQADMQSCGSGQPDVHAKTEKNVFPAMPLFIFSQPRV